MEENKLNINEQKKESAENQEKRLSLYKEQIEKLQKENKENES